MVKASWGDLPRETKEEEEDEASVDQSLTPIALVKSLQVTNTFCFHVDHCHADTSPAP